MADMINPLHYRGDRQFEPIAVIEDWGLNYRLGNALKYIARNGRKPGEDPREGIRKAIWYLEREIASYDEAPHYPVTYEDVLEAETNAAIDGYEYILATNEELYGWDDSIGPVESDFDSPDPEEAALKYRYPSCDVDLDELHKDLDQFERSEIIHTFERRGIMFGIDKNGRTYTLGLYDGPVT